MRLKKTNTQALQPTRLFKISSCKAMNVYLRGHKVRMRS